MIPDPESKIPHVAGQLTPCATTTEPVSTTRRHCSGAHTQLRAAPAHRARDGPRAATNPKAAKKSTRRRYSGNGHLLSFSCKKFSQKMRVTKGRNCLPSVKRRERMWKCQKEVTSRWELIKRESNTPLSEKLETSSQVCSTVEGLGLRKEAGGPGLVLLDSQSSRNK